MRSTIFVCGCLLLALLLAGCASGAGLDAGLRAVIAERDLSGDPSLGRELPDIEEPLAQLGLALFYSKSLSGDLDAACVSCHHPLLGGGDGLPLSIGVGADDPDLLGPGRTHPEGPKVPRNAPTTFNIGLWDQALFWDGRVENLGMRGIRTPDSYFGAVDPEAGADLAAAQSRFPLTSVEEMRGDKFEAHRPNAFVRDHLCTRLADKGWPQAFAAVFGDEAITDARIAAALSAYQRSQVFVDTPWRAYVQGDDGAISAAAKRGALLFFGDVENSGAGCASCHAGDFFTDEGFHALGIPQIGPGKEDGRLHSEDFGRFRESGDPADLYAFRTPTLLNVEVTGPYGHDGAYDSLETVIRHHLNPTAAARSYDFAALDPAISLEQAAVNTERVLARLEENQRSGTAALPEIELSRRDVRDLVSFLKTLTDPCVKDAACLAPWIPDAADLDPDGLRLIAKFVGAGIQ